MNAAEVIRSLAASASIEVTPKHVGRLPELAPGTSVYITSLPGAEHGELVSAAVAVRAAGHRPIPHIAARGFTGRDELDALLGRMADEAGVDDVLVIGGGLKAPAGTITCSMDVLESGLLERHGILRAGVAGHPEGTPDIPPDVVRAALAEKNAFARRSPVQLRIVTQFALTPEPYVAWERATRADGNGLPVIAGIPGVTSPTALLKFALACGVGPSMEVFRKQSGGLLRLATTRLWRPDAVLAGIADAVAADPQSLIRGLHVFPFGGVGESAAWLAEKSAFQAAQPA